MPNTVEVKQVPEQPLAVVRGIATMANLPARIRALFDEFYAGFKGKGGLNVVFYPGWSGGECEIACGVQVEQGGNAATPAGTAATTVHMGSYDRMKPPTKRFISGLMRTAGTLRGHHGRSTGTGATIRRSSEQIFTI